MSLNINSGSKLILKPAEEIVPYEYWLSYLKNLAVECVLQFHLPVNVGKKYNAEDFWSILIAHCWMNVSLDEASDRMNQMLWDAENSHRRQKVAPEIYQGDIIRKSRKCPNGDQVRKYRNTLPKWLVDNLNQHIFEKQIDFALRENMISYDIDILVDNTSEWYYGNDRYPQNPFITKGYNGPGTSRKRNYLGIMLKCGAVYLYCGVDIIKKKHSNVPFILETVDFLRKKGFNVRYLIGDRWFPTAELLKELPSRNIDFIGP